MAPSSLNSKPQASYAIGEVISNNSAEEIGERLREIDYAIKNENPGAQDVRFTMTEDGLCASWQIPRREPEPYDPRAHLEKIARRRAAIRRKAMKRFIEARRAVTKLDWQPTEGATELLNPIPSTCERTDAS